MVVMRSLAGGADEDGARVLGVKPSLAVLVDSIIELWRERQDHHRAEKRLSLQLLARCRRLAAGDKAAARTRHDAMVKAWAGKGGTPEAEADALLNRHLLAARAVIAEARKALEKELKVWARGLPVADFVAATPGFDWLGLAAVTGEAGDLAGYANPAKLWKRMGLAVMPDGGRQRKVAGAAALEHGYAPARRSVIWTLGAALWKTQGPYRELYLARKEIERAKAEAAGLTVRPAAKIPAKNKAAFMSVGHIHNRAQRYIEKRLLRELWRAWRRATTLGTTPMETPSPGADLQKAVL